MDPWENDPYELPILEDATYRCSCGCAAKMDWFYGGPAYAHHKHYAIRCRMPNCKLHMVRMQDWKHTPADAIVAWNRRCLKVSEKRDRDENAKIREQVVQLMDDLESESDYANILGFVRKRLGIEVGDD